MRTRQNGTLMVSASVGKKKNPKITTSERILPVAKIEGDVSTVSVMMGLTLSLGKFEFAKIDVTCAIPCENTDEARKAAYEKAKDFSEKHLQEEVAKVRG